MYTNRICDRSVGGFTYHVEHPGGLNPDTLPVNAFEAESRLVSRFWEFGHSPVSVVNPSNITDDTGRKMPYSDLPVTETGEYPYTLDLRHVYS